MDVVGLLERLLRIDTTNPPGNEGAAAELLGSVLQEAGLETKVVASPQGRPNLVARLPGPTDRPALVLVSHTDVVGVEEGSWTQDPFGAAHHDGSIYGRGALDMKSVACMHVAAAIAAARSGREPHRELIVCAVADEEAGGDEGARWLLDSHPEVVGFEDGRPPPEVLGEGGYGLSDVLSRPIMPVVMAEKQALWLKLRAEGEPGHGSLPPKEQAIANLAAVLGDISGYSSPRVHPVMREQFRAFAGSGDKRAPLFRALASSAGPTLAKALAKPLRSSGTIAALLSDTVTPTQLSSGYKQNVVPGEAEASLDCRLLPDTDVAAFVATIRKKATKHNVSVGVPRDLTSAPPSDRTSLFEVLVDVSNQLDERPLTVPSLTPGITDLRYFRARGATAYGWVPLVLDAELLGTIHGHDERIPIDGYERAVAAMVEVVGRSCGPS